MVKNRKEILLMLSHWIKGKNKWIQWPQVWIQGTKMSRGLKQRRSWGKTQSGPVLGMVSMINRNLHSSAAWWSKEFVNALRDKVILKRWWLLLQRAAPPAWTNAFFALGSHNRWSWNLLWQVASYTRRGTHCLSGTCWSTVTADLGVGNPSLPSLLKFLKPW